jgi:Arc/MetJ-type ribon-helix-helix transcriptional regulator
MCDRATAHAVASGLIYDEVMRETKIVVTMPLELLKRARAQVAAGSAESVSALLRAALEEKMARNDLADILDTIDAKRVPASADRVATRLLKGGSSTIKH